MTTACWCSNGKNVYSEFSTVQGCRLLQWANIYTTVNNIWQFSMNIFTTGIQANFCHESTTRPRSQPVFLYNYSIYNNYSLLPIGRSVVIQNPCSPMEYIFTHPTRTGLNGHAHNFHILLAVAHTLSEFLLSYFGMNYRSQRIACEVIQDTSGRQLAVPVL